MKKLFVILACGFLIGCDSYTYESESAPLKETSYHLSSAASPTGLTQEDTAGLDATLATVPANSIRLAIIEQGGVDNAVKVQGLESYLLQRGFTMKNIFYDQQPSVIDGVTLTLRYRSYLTYAECGEWLSEGAFNSTNAVERNLGCSTANNMRAMVENQNDLLLPRSERGAVTETAVRAVGIYNGSLQPTATPVQAEASESRTTDDE